MIIIEEKKKFSAEDEHVSYKKIKTYTHKRLNTLKGVVQSRELFAQLKKLQKN